MAKFKRILKKKTENQLIKVFISYLKRQIAKKEKKNKKFSFVLTGGSSPIRLYRSLAKTKINWKNIDLFWGDERYVSKKSINSNYKLVYINLIKKIKINNNNIFDVNTNKASLLASAYDYHKRIKKYFNNKKVSFDLVLLGMGSDGHVASIFPKELKNNKGKIVYGVVKKDFERITLSMKTINNAKKIFLWLNTPSKLKSFKKLNERKDIPVNRLNKKKTIVFTRY